MKVLYISYDGVFDPVGQSQVIPYLRGLAKKGAEIYLISFEKSDKIHNKLDENIPWTPLVYHKYPTFPATLFDILNGFLRGRALIKKSGKRIVHGRGYIAGLIAYLIKKLYNVKFIFDMRGFWPEEKVDAGAWKKGGFLYRLFKLLEKELFLASDEIIVLTEAAKVVIEKKYKLNNISVIPCCVDLENSPAEFAVGNLPKGRLLVVYLGSVGTFYDFEGIARFFNEFKKISPRAYFLILSHSDKGYITGILKNFNIDAADYFVTHLPHDKVPAALSRAAFSLIFYKRKFSAAGCCPVKFAESLACGVPVVINSGIGDCDHIVSQDKVGVILKEESYASAAYEIINLMQDKEEIARRCLSAARRYFSLQSGLEKYLNIYIRLAG